MHALKEHPDLTYVMAMQESLVVAIADGFSRASGRLVACNVHVAPGLGNAMGSLFNASFTGTPMILTAGQQEQGHGLMEPVLYGPLVQMAEPLVKWAVEVTRLEDLPRIVRRAAKIATTPPTGPVFISLPGDILNAEAGIELGRSTRVDTRVKPSDEALQALAQRILKAERPVIITGDEIVKSDALRRPRRWPKRSAARPTSRRRLTEHSFLSESPCFMGALSRLQKQVREVLSPYDLMIVLGADPLRMSVYSEVDPLPDGLSDRAGRPGRLGSRQELRRRDRAEGRCEGNPARAGSGAESCWRRRARSSRAKQGIAALARRTGPREARRWSSRYRRPATDRRSIRTGWRCRWSRRCRDNAILVDEGLTSSRQITGAAPAPRPLRLSRAGVRRHRLGICRPRSASAWPIRTGRWCVFPATAARCIRSRRCGPRRTTSCR